MCQLDPPSSLQNGTRTVTHAMKLTVRMRAVAPTCVSSLPLPLSSFRRMAVSPCPWSSVEEWDNVFDLLFSSDTDSQRKGISRVGYKQASYVMNFV